MAKVILIRTESITTNTSYEQDQQQAYTNNDTNTKTKTTTTNDNNEKSTFKPSSTCNKRSTIIQVKNLQLGSQISNLPKQRIPKILPYSSQTGNSNSKATVKIQIQLQSQTEQLN